MRLKKYKPDQVMVANELHIEGRERPADRFVNRWTAADPAAVDVAVTHPLAPSLGLNILHGKRGGCPTKRLLAGVKAGDGVGLVE